MSRSEGGSISYFGITIRGRMTHTHDGMHDGWMRGSGERRRPVRTAGCNFGPHLFRFPLSFLHSGEYPILEGLIFRIYFPDAGATGGGCPALNVYSDVKRESERANALRAVLWIDKHKSQPQCIHTIAIEVFI